MPLIGARMIEKIQYSADRYAGCRMFVSKDGRSGFALGVEGDRAGWLYDFFVSADEPAEMADSLVKFAVEQGARQLVTYEYPFLENFYLRSGFETRNRVRYAQLQDPPQEWVPDFVAAESLSCPDFLCMVRRSDGVAAKSMMSDTVDFASRPGTVTYPQSCKRCGRELPALSWLRIISGYHCRDCDFLHVEGVLALSVWGPSGSTSMKASSARPGPGKQQTMFTSGAGLLQQ